MMMIMIMHSYVISRLHFNSFQANWAAAQVIYTGWTYFIFRTASQQLMCQRVNVIEC